jgi:hypothetical protein
VNVDVTASGAIVVVESTSNLTIQNSVFTSEISNGVAFE